MQIENPILAGPILRRTNSDCVCVWVATSTKVEIKGEILVEPNSTEKNNSIDLHV